jgi:hypothetical protein
MRIFYLPTPHTHKHAQTTHFYIQILTYTSLFLFFPLQNPFHTDKPIHTGINQHESSCEHTHMQTCTHNFLLYQNQHENIHTYSAFLLFLQYTAIYTYKSNENNNTLTRAHLIASRVYNCGKGGNSGEDNSWTRSSQTGGSRKQPSNARSNGVNVKGHGQAKWRQDQLQRSVAVGETSVAITLNNAMFSLTTQKNYKNKI